MSHLPSRKIWTAATILLILTGLGVAVGGVPWGLFLSNLFYSLILLLVFTAILVFLFVVLRRIGQRK